MASLPNIPYKITVDDILRPTKMRINTGATEEKLKRTVAQLLDDSVLGILSESPKPRVVPKCAIHRVEMQYDPPRMQWCCPGELGNKPCWTSITDEALNSCPKDQEVIVV